MIRKLRIRFILIASAAITCILLAMVGVLNSARFLQTNGTIRSVLNILSDNGGAFPDIKETARGLNNEQITIDTIYQYRYFSFEFEEDGSVHASNLDYISNLTDQEALSFARQVLSQDKSSGTFGRGRQIYAYQVTPVKGSKRSLVVILDATNYFEDRNDFLVLSIQMALYSLLFFVLVVSVLSNMAISPYIRNFEKQKRFITNAGHELKTPLAIISANTELQELMTGENEWTESTKDQVGRLSNLISQMVSLARLEENDEVALERVDFSQTVDKVAGNFRSLTEQAGLDYSLDIQEGIEVQATQDGLYELVSILLDNACKYCDEGGQIQVSLSKPKRRKRARLIVANSYAEGSQVDYSRFFDRFYRQDQSRNQKTAGYGIGLSMAESLTHHFKGRISVAYKNGMIRFTVLI